MDIYGVFFEPGEVCEIRAVAVAEKKNKNWDGFAASGVVSGYFDAAPAFAAAASALDHAKAKGVYFTLNPVNPALLSRAVNRLKVQKTTSQDKDITCIRWLPIDLDPLRPADISSTDEEFTAAKELAAEISAWLENDCGFARGLRCVSGNGFHLLYRLPDLPNTAETHDMVVAAIAAIAAKFKNEHTDIDVTTVNPARIWKLYGTTGRKGDSTTSRPHRVSYIYPGQAETLAAVPVTDAETLKKLAATNAPIPPKGMYGNSPPKGGALPPAARTSGNQQAKAFGNNLGPLDMERYLTHYGIAYKKKDDSRGGTLFALDHCLFNPDHSNGEAAIITDINGRPLYQCFHSSCKGKRWADARKIISGDKPIAEFCAGYDPNWRPPTSQGSGLIADLEISMSPTVDAPGDVPPPEVVDVHEFYKKKGSRPVFIPLYMAKYLAAYLAPIVHTSGVFYRYSKGLWRDYSRFQINHIMAVALKEDAMPSNMENATKILSAIINQEEDMWPDEKRYINCQNGMLDIDTMELMPHDPKYGSRVKLPVNYTPGAWSQRWWNFLDDIFPDDHNQAKRGVLQQFMGYILLRDCRYQKALFLYGTGANGKSTVLDIIQAMVGEENTSSLSLSDLTQRFKAQFLQNKMINIATETNSRDPLATELLKALIAGDPITAEHKYGEQFQFKPFAKFIAAMNDPPVVPDKSYGFGRRIVLLSFDRRFSDEEIKTDIAQKIIEEIDGVFAWAVEGLRLLLRNKRFIIPQQVADDTSGFMETLNPLLIFVNEMCVVHDTAKISTTDLWDMYQEWCAAGKNRPLGRNRFYDQILQTFPRVKKTQVKREDASVGERLPGAGPDSRIWMFDGLGVTPSAMEWLTERRVKNSGNSRRD